MHLWTLLKNLEINGCKIIADGFDIFGINHNNIDTKFNSRHAEVDAVTKLHHTEKQKQMNITRKQRLADRVRQNTSVTPPLEEGFINQNQMGE